MLTLVWGTNWPLFALATREVSVWTFRAVAVLVASLFLLGVARLRGQSLVLPGRHWLRMGIATSLYLVLWNIASTYAALMSWLLLGERPTARMAVKVPATVFTG